MLPSRQVGGVTNKCCAARRPSLGVQFSQCSLQIRCEGNSQRCVRPSVGSSVAGPVAVVAAALLVASSSRWRCRPRRALREVATSKPRVRDLGRSRPAASCGRARGRGSPLVHRSLPPAGPRIDMPPCARRGRDSSVWPLRSRRRASPCGLRSLGRATPLATHAQPVYSHPRPPAPALARRAARAVRRHPAAIMFDRYRHTHTQRGRSIPSPCALHHATRRERTHRSNAPAGHSSATPAVATCARGREADTLPETRAHVVRPSHHTIATNRCTS